MNANLASFPSLDYKQTVKLYRVPAPYPSEIHAPDKAIVLPLNGLFAS